MIRNFWLVIERTSETVRYRRVHVLSQSRFNMSHAYAPTFPLDAQCAR
jgi:hypothetical protein